MLRAFVSRCPALLTVSLLLAGCGLFDPTVVEVSLTLSASEVAPDSAVQVEVRAKNLSSDPIQISVQGCPRGFEILDEVGTVVGPGPTVCSLALLAPLSLEPGQSHTTVYEWRGERNDVDWTRLPEGDYRVRGWVDVVTEGRVYTEKKTVRVLDVMSSGL